MLVKAYIMALLFFSTSCDPVSKWVAKISGTKWHYIGLADNKGKCVVFNMIGMDRSPIQVYDKALDFFNEPHIEEVHLRSIYKTIDISSIPEMKEQTAKEWLYRIGGLEDKMTPILVKLLVENRLLPDFMKDMKVTINWLYEDDVVMAENFVKVSSFLDNQGDTRPDTINNLLAKQQSFKDEIVDLLPHLDLINEGIFAKPTVSDKTSVLYSLSLLRKFIITGKGFDKLLGAVEKVTDKITLPNYDKILLVSKKKIPDVVLAIQDLEEQVLGMINDEIPIVNVKTLANSLNTLKLSLYGTSVKTVRMENSSLNKKAIVVTNKTIKLCIETDDKPFIITTDGKGLDMLNKDQLKEVLVMLEEIEDCDHLKASIIRMLN